jgi:amino-acid N-acetyltransferase
MIRKAHIKDAKKIQSLINGYAARDLMMPRSLNEIYDNLRDFWVIDNERTENVIGCAALHIIGWDNLAEIKSLAVEKKHQGKGLGCRLIEAILKEARDLHIKNVFALSYKPKFFKKFGFRVIAKAKLPHKVWAECCNCPKFPNCGEIALIRKIG